MALQRHMRVLDDSENAERHSGLKVAFATTDMKTVNQHFGSAESFAMYMVNPDEASLLEAAQFEKPEEGDNEDKLAEKIKMLEGCTAVYCQAIGSSAIKQLVMRGIQPVKVTEGAEVDDLIKALQDEMRLGPSAWLAKAIARHKTPDMSRFDAMDDEGWDE